MVKVGVLVGSLSRQAYSLRLAQYLATRLPEVEMLQLDYSELPFYNPDLERTEPPMEWTAFREAVRRSIPQVWLGAQLKFASLTNHHAFH